MSDNVNVTDDNNKKSNYQRIAKNTLLLYLRTGITMAVSLYTSRIVLSALGIEDFGIWCVVGGIASMFLFIKESLSASVGRFLTFAIGTKNQQEINKAYSTSIIIHVIFAIAIVILCESIGLWFLKEKLSIPEGKMWLAYWVFHISVASTFLSIVSVPFHSSLISYERMDIYAYIGLWDAFIKLVIAYVITVVSNDRLLVYGILILASSILTTIFVITYVHHSFPKMRYYRVRERRMYTSVFSFAGWSLMGNVAYMSYTQGLNMIINMFFGPVVNAARGVSSQIEQSVRTFVVNFQVAANPQIIKNCANKDWESMHQLMYRSSKFSAYLLFLFSLPIVLEIDTILRLWLNEVPEYTAIFCRIMFGIIMLETISNSLMVGVSAQGDIKKYQLVVSSILLTILPISYIALSLGYGPDSVFIIYFIVEIFACIARLLIAREKIHVPVRLFFTKVIIVVSYTIIVGSFLPTILHIMLPEGLLRFVIVLTLGAVTSGVSIYYLGLDSREKSFVHEKVFSHICRRKKY